MMASLSEPPFKALYLTLYPFFSNVAASYPMNILPFLLITPIKWKHGCCFSFAQLCPTLHDPMNCITLYSPVFLYLPEFAQTQVH